MQQEQQVSAEKPKHVVCQHFSCSRVLNDHAPIKSRKIRSAPGQSKFITHEIRKAMWKRNALKRKYYKTRSSVDWEAFRTQRNRVVSVRRKSVVNYFDRLCVSRAGNPREFRRAVRPFMHVKKSAPEQCITLKLSLIHI